VIVENKKASAQKLMLAVAAILYSCPSRLPSNKTYFHSFRQVI